MSKKLNRRPVAPHDARAASTPIQEVTGVPRPGTMTVPILPLVDSVVFPRSVYPLALQGEQSQLLARVAGSERHLVALFMQKELASNPPGQGDLHRVGTLAHLENIREAPDGLIDVTAVGLERVELVQVTEWEPVAQAEVQLLESDDRSNEALAPMAHRVYDLYTALLAADPRAEQKLRPVLEATTDPLDLAFLVASTVPISPAGRQALLETPSTSGILLQLTALLGKAHEMDATSKLIARNDVLSGSDAPANPSGNGHTLAAVPGSGSVQLEQSLADRAELQAALQAAQLPPEAARVAERELARLTALAPTSPDYSIVRGYLQWLADLPWQSGEEPHIDLERARTVLDGEHYGLEDVKQRIVEYLAVRKLRSERTASAHDAISDAGTALAREPILCLVGPPGIGKTSLGRSIAAALDRPFVRLSLGGVSDEAEIRGHRRTYLGAMPGKLLRSLARLGTRHPVVMLDELDKVGGGGKGDPAAALLEVLDPEQQHSFLDHYIDIPYDLSSVFFIATANMLDNVPPALSDRLEVIQLSGYTEEEKVQIALRHIIPDQMQAHALNEGDASWEEDAVLSIIRNYTREAGVRQMEREIATICRRVATLVAQETQDGRCEFVINADFVSDVLGSPRFLPDQPEVTDQPGIVTGVVWTPVGGDLIYVEASMMPGNKTLTITGQLGEIMRESAQAALSYVRARATALGIDDRFFERNDIHLHVPSGAVQKDGPSAGVTMAVALVSLLTRKPVSSDVAMSGEITLRGRVLPVGGIKEKVLAARRAGIRRLIVPAQNRRDVDDLSPEMLDDLEITFADTMEEVLEGAGLRPSKGTARGKRNTAGQNRSGSHSDQPADAMPRAAKPREKRTGYRT